MGDLWTGRLTLRLLLCYIRHLPEDSATARAVTGHAWTTQHYLIADLFHAFTGKAHPARPAGESQHDHELEERLRDLKRRSEERRAQREVTQ